MKSPFSQEQTNKFLNNYYNYLRGLIFLLIAVIGFFFLLWPQYQTLRINGILEQGEAVNLLTERENYLKDVNLMQSKYDVLSLRAFESLAYILPKEDETYLLFAQMEDLAKANNLELNSININTVGEEVAKKSAKEEKTTLSKNIKKVGININIEGIDSYENFKNFLNNLENNIKILDVKSLSYYPDKSGYTISLTTYYLVDNSQSANAVPAPETNEEI